MTHLWNILVFLSAVIPAGIPPWDWPRAWRFLQERHERETRRLLTQLTMTGQVKRRIVDGEFRYYPLDEDDEDSR